MKISNRFILDQLYFGDPKITPLSVSWLEYTAKVHEVITDEFRKEIGANPVKGSSLDVRIGKASKNFAKIARKKFKKHSRNYKRSVAQHFFKIKTHIPLREKKATPNPGPSKDATATPSAAGDSGSSTTRSKTQKPFSELGRTQKTARVNDLKAAASGDVDLLLATSASAAKGLDVNRHFVLKKLLKHPGLAEDLKRFIENDCSK